MPQKENRKIVRIGKTSLGIILPKAWLRYFSINAGDEVEVISNGHITVRPLITKTNNAGPFSSEESA
ncbi:AbrB/MazE/SpoVT family DNA-binding domain-containing protein [Candidatus Bathyarchaeota archaeon]|nr:AbrB/MazE/SpoVT family DNA-binding domain-containing protein [Candidatus Bathyarchaeota archaeon]